MATASAITTPITTCWMKGETPSRLSPLRNTPMMRPTTAGAPGEIAGHGVTAPADTRATGVTIRVKVPAGRTRLKAWFSDAAGMDLCGAFYVTVAKL